MSANRFNLFLCAALAFCAQESFAADSSATNACQPINLVTVLRLADARSIDIEIAKQRLAEARANHDASVLQFVPWISAGFGYRRHDDLIQDVQGNIIDVHKESYTVGPTILAQWDIGDAMFKELASRQLMRAATHGFDAQRQDSLFAAAQAYFDLVKADASVAVANEAFRISTNYFAQIRQASDAGIAFKGDVLRVQVQAEQNQNAVTRAHEQVKIASAKLVQALHLEGTVRLVPDGSELVPLNVISTNDTMKSLVARALNVRPELKQQSAVVSASKKAKDGAVYGPLIPSVGAQVFAGGLGGGRDHAPSTFGESEDYQVSIGWRIGPGGLFDTSRKDVATARLKTAELNAQKLVDEITREVVEDRTRVESLASQMATAQRTVQIAQETLRLSEGRKEFAVGNVLEVIQSEQDLTRARLEYLNAVADFDKAQFALLRAISGTPEMPAK